MTATNTATYGPGSRRRARNGRTTTKATTTLTGNTSVHVSTDEAFPFAVYTPAARNLGLDASGYTHLAAFFRAQNSKSSKA